MRRIGLLILSCGTNAMQHFIQVLNREFCNQFRIVGADTNDRWLVPRSELLAGFYKVPASASGNYVSAIEEILKIENPDFILPSFDADQQLFYDGASLLRKYGVRSLSTPYEMLGVYSSKRKMFEALVAAGFPVPRIYDASELMAHQMYFIKPIDGVGSVGVSMCTGKEIGKMDCRDFLIQECCSGPEVTMECFAFGGRFSCVCRRRMAVKSGVCVKACVYSSPRLEKIGREFVSHFKVPWFFNLQFMANGTGDPVITDVNLRAAGGMGLSYAAGWDEVSAIAKILLGRSVDDVFSTLPESVPEQYVVRTYQDCVMRAMEKCVAFDFDGTLLDSRVRHRIVMEKVLCDRGIAVDVSDLVEFKRSGKNNVDFLVSKGIELAQAQAIQKNWVSLIEGADYLKYDALYPYAKDVLARYGGWRKILLTARSNVEGLQRQLDETGLRDSFDEIVIVRPGAQVATEKKMALEQCGALEFWGDTYSDYTAALGADVKFRYCKDGFHLIDLPDACLAVRKGQNDQLFFDKRNSL